MTILLDASALVAIATNEPGFATLGDALDDHEDRLCCALGIWEAALAVARKRKVSMIEAADAIDDLLARLEIRMVPIGEAETLLALDAHRRYGKGTGHPAKLNMGDCFAYACAKANQARLLHQGNDFSHTDLA